MAFQSCNSLVYNLDKNGNKYLGNETNKYLIFVDSSSKDITRVTIGSGCKIIMYSAFNNCSSLTSITLPSTITEIGESAFYGCSSLTSIVLPSELTTICDRAFSECSSLTSITLPERVASIGIYAFRNCRNLTKIIVEAGSTLSTSLSIISLSGTWYKDGEVVTAFSGAGTYTKQTN